MYEDYSKKVRSCTEQCCSCNFGSTLPFIGNCIENTTGLGNSRKRRELHTTVWVYRCLKPGVTPPYLHDIFQPIRKQHQHHTRLSDHGVLIPRAHTNMMLKSFHYRGAVVWNSLPGKVLCITRESAFRSALKLFYNESSN